MSYDISEILKLPVTEQEEIAIAIFKNLNSSDQEDKDVEEELDHRFAKVESGNYSAYTVDEIKAKLAAKWQSD